MSETTLREAVEALAFGEAATAILTGVVGSSPGSYSGISKDEALDYAGELVTDLRARLAAPPPAVPDAPRTDQRGEGALAKAWSEGHAAGRDYQGDGWNSDAHDPEADNPYRNQQ